MKKITPIIDDDEFAKFILSDGERSTTVTAKISDTDTCHKVLKEIFSSETVDLQDILALNDDGIVAKAVSTSAYGKKCVSQALKKAFSYGVTNTAAILVTVSQNLRSFAEIENFLSNEEFFTQDGGYVIWKVIREKKFPKNAICLDAIIFT